MLININGFNFSMSNVTDQQIHTLIQILGIPLQAFQRSEYKGRLKLEYGLLRDKKSIALSLGQLQRTSFAIGYYQSAFVKLDGSFFDKSPDFQLKALLQFLDQSISWSPKQLDISYLDDEQQLTVNDYRLWLGSDWKSYCAGSLFKHPPKELTAAGNFCLFQLGSPSSKANHATIYVNPETGFLDHKVTFRDSVKVRYLLKKYSEASLQQFTEQAINALVSCMDFITPSSHETKAVAKYVRQHPYQSFVKSNAKKINWRKVKQHRAECQNEPVNRNHLKRVSARLQNLISK
jgi:hypothetical protein